VSRSYPDLSPFATGWRCRCPQCGEGRLFSGLLQLRPRCSSCGLDYASIDAGDGPAVFVILVVGLIVTGLAGLTEAKFEPPYWVHALLWTPVTLGLSLWLLRPFKAVLLALQFKNKAAEARLDTDA